MGITHWVFRRFLNEKNLGYVIEKARPMIQAELDSYGKDTIIGILNDEEVAGAVDQYSKAILDNRLKQFWSSVGGVSKGVNHQIDLGLTSNSLVDQILDGDHLNLGAIIKFALSGGLKNLGQGQTNTSGSRGTIGLAHGR